MTARLKR